MIDYRSEIFDLNVFLVTSNVCLDPGLGVMKILNIVDILRGVTCGGLMDGCGRAERCQERCSDTRC